MNNIRKTSVGFLVFGMLASFTIFGGTKTATPASAFSSNPNSLSSAPNRAYSADDFIGETATSDEELGVSITQSTVTGTSQYLTVAFRSKTLAGYRTAKANYIIGIDDPNFTGDDANPAPEGYDKYNEDTGLPEFTGYVAYLVGSNQQSSNQKVYIPSTLTRAGSFTIKVTSIAAGCVSADGHEYSGNNKWEKITDVYIPNTIERVETGAFTGVPADGSVKIHYEGNSLPDTVFEAGWVDVSTTDTNVFDISSTSYSPASNKKANVGGTKVELPDPLGRPLNFVLGYIDETHNFPLVIQYDRVIKENGVETSRVTHYDSLELNNTSGNPYDACGPMSSNTYTRSFGYKVGPNEYIDDESVVFHNIMKASPAGVTDFSTQYFVKPLIGYSEKQHIENLVNVRPSNSSTFAGYSLFTLKMDKNLSITSHRYPEPHSLYLDVKTDIYEQNIAQIKSGQTIIRYSLYNLYNSSYHFKYIGSDGTLKDVVKPIKTVISYQILTKDSDNLVSILVKNSDIGADFSAEKVRLFELQEITIQMDLQTTTTSDSVAILAKSSISYKFAYITIFDNVDANTPLKVFSWDMFLIIFFIAYIVVYAAAAFVTYRIMKEKFKNDEFRRVNDKKFLKQAIIGGFGLGEVLLAVLFLIMRTSGFKNTIVVFNPTDPILIATAIVGMIIIGYFIVYVVKLVKAEKDRRKAIRLKLNEDVDDDGTK